MISAGYLQDRIYIYEPEVEESDFGDRVVFDHENPDHTIWANVKYQKGSQIMKHGDIMMANTIVVTCRRHATFLTERVRIGWHGKIYRIASFNEDTHDNQVTMTCEKIES